MSDEVDGFLYRLVAGFHALMAVGALATLALIMPSLAAGEGVLGSGWIETVLAAVLACGLAAVTGYAALRGLFERRRAADVLYRVQTLVVLLTGGAAVVDPGALTAAGCALQAFFWVAIWRDRRPPGTAHHG